MLKLEFLVGKVVFKPLNEVPVEMGLVNTSRTLLSFSWLSYLAVFSKDSLSSGLLNKVRFVPFSV